MELGITRQSYIVLIYRPCLANFRFPDLPLNISDGYYVNKIFRLVGQINLILKWLIVLSDGKCILYSYKEALIYNVKYLLWIPQSPQFSHSFHSKSGDASMFVKLCFHCNTHLVSRCLVGHFRIARRTRIGDYRYVVKSFRHCNEKLKQITILWTSENTQRSGLFEYCPHCTILLIWLRQMDQEAVQFL